MSENKINSIYEKAATTYMVSRMDAILGCKVVVYCQDETEASEVLLEVKESGVADKLYAAVTHPGDKPRFLKYRGNANTADAPAVISNATWGSGYEGSGCNLLPAIRN